MKNKSIKSGLMVTTTICSAVLASIVTLPSVAIAQDAATSSEDAPVTEVVVTGSRIARKDFVSPSPITTVSSAQIEASGSLAVEQILNTLPQVVPGFSAASNNPSDGTATVDLRGLGASRTLVLVNGHRMTPATKASSATDLNTIPARLIKRVEVMTGGASATYGSDALAGVVNFVLKDDFEGIELSSQYGLSAEGDAEQFDTSLIMGTNFDGGKGNLTAFVSYYDRDQVLGAERDWAFYSNAGGSATGLSGRADNVALNPYALTPTQAGCPTVTNRQISFTPTGEAHGFCNDFDLTNPVTDQYNFSPVNNLMSPSERISLSLLGHYDFTENLRGKLEVFFTDNRTSSQLAPTPMTGLSVPIDNPFISASFASLLAGRTDPTANFVFRKRMLEVGVRQQDHNNKMFQFVTGLDGTVFSDWKWDSTFSYGRTEFKDSTFNDVSRSRMIAATRGASDGATTTSCGAAQLAIMPACKPFNLFGAGSASQEALDFVRLDFSDTTTFERFVVGGNIAGDAFVLPAGAVGVAAGFEYREDTFSFAPDAAHGSGDIYGFNAERPVSGGYNVKEVYGEATVPLVAEVPFVKYLGLELGARFSDYSSVGKTEAYKAGLEWKIDDDFRFRGMYQKASRAPSVFELYQAGDQGFPQFTDPCSTKSPTSGADRTISQEVRDFCALQLGGDPVTLGYIQPNSQLESFSFGNANLKAEQSETITVGAVWRPSYIEGLSVTLDYYDIKVDDYINTLYGGAAGTVAACFATLDLNSAACFNSDIGQSAIYRDTTGELKIRTSQGNVSALETKGIDLAVDYKAPLGWLVKDSTLFSDKLDINVLVTKLESWKLDDIEYAGTAGAYNISATLPEWKSNIRLAYNIGPVLINWSSTFYSEMENQGNLAIFEDGGYSTVPNYWVHDVQARWGVNSNVDLTAGIKNLTDEDPPVFDNSPDGNTDPNAFDVIGRYYYVGMKFKL
ncbi:TonB-dependent receptor [Asticcacaulis sp. ZE23SCel15]|uniref:TonB-dependent receptor plug domain-containing protein n=1 Tax=Asticcacaulis sp. ZE23SCel15 TaxID=3059027 RepID=UPI0026600C58|nr:TonB-dependent receptor [Asticcacaulis sp. ZE23SCel15]WKL56535.1 TonB-dependent receptor [Asticcacaulis sp. ZE23SCel15]